MPRKKGTQKTDTQIVGATSSQKGNPLAQAVATGLETTDDLVGYMRGVLVGLSDGTVSTGTANAAANTTGKIIKLVELKQKYGKTPKDVTPRVLRIKD